MQQQALRAIYVYNLVPETTETDLYRLFSPFGAIASVKVPPNPSTSASETNTGDDGHQQRTVQRLRFRDDAARRGCDIGDCLAQRALAQWTTITSLLQDGEEALV